MKLKNLKQYFKIFKQHPDVLFFLTVNYLKLFSGKKCLRGIEFSVTYNCQLKCEHCLKNNITNKDQELSIKEIKNTVIQLKKLGAININITGGEPLLRDDIFKILTECSLTGVYLTLATNGLLLNNSIARNLRRTGVKMVSISVDSYKPNIHDKRRKLEGSHDKALKAAEICLQNDLDVFLCTILTKELIESGEVEELRNLAWNEMGVFLTVNLPYLVGGWSSDCFNKLDQSHYDYYYNLLKKPGIRWEGDANYFKSGCPAGTEKLYITPYGDVMPCAVLQQSFGNIRNSSIKDIYNSIIKTPVLKNKSKKCLAAEDIRFTPEFLKNINKNEQKSSLMDL